MLQKLSPKDLEATLHHRSLRGAEAVLPAEAGAVAAALGIAPTAFSKALANALRIRLRTLIGNQTGTADRIAVNPLTGIRYDLYTAAFGEPTMAPTALIEALLRLRYVSITAPHTRGCDALWESSRKTFAKTETR